MHSWEMKQAAPVYPHTADRTWNKLILLSALQWPCANTVILSLAICYLLKFSAVLVLTVGELIFFTGAGVGLCFGFVLENVLISQGCFPYC